MANENPRISQEEYESFLYALKNLGKVNKLSNSRLMASSLVLNRIEENPSLSPHEALRNILTEFLGQVETWSPVLGGILRARFWDQRTVDEMSELGIPKEYAPRTILDKQREGIYQLAAWFMEKEKLCKQSKLIPNHKPSGSEARRSTLVENIADFTVRKPIFSTVFFRDFAQASVDHIHKSWEVYGGANITPTIQQLNKHKVLNFPQLPDQHVNKDLINKEVRVSPPYQIKIKFAFQNEPADRAGIVVGWQNRSTLIRIQPNLYWNHISYWEHISSGEAYRHKVPLSEVIELYKPYYLLTQTGFINEKEKYIIVFWGTDEQNLTPVMAIQNVHHPLAGYLGLSTSGPNLPHVHFYSLHMAY